MRWDPVYSNSDNEIYHLKNGNKHLLTLSINPFTQSARVECKEQKRVFLIRKEGFLRNKTILCNEYGIRIGEIGQENNEDFIDLNNERFFYTFSENENAKLVLYKEAIEQPFVSCGISNQDGNKEVDFKNDNTIAATSYPGLLMALCWYMFLPVSKENTTRLTTV